jgi:hypothetical protein
MMLCSEGTGEGEAEKASGSVAGVRRGDESGDADAAGDAGGGGDAGCAEAAGT